MISKNQFKKLIGKTAIRVGNCLGNKFCMLNIGSIENVEDVPISMLAYYKKKDYVMLPCKETGVSITDLHGDKHDILSFVNLSGQLELISVLSKFKSVYSGKPNTVCLTNSLCYITTPDHESYLVAAKIFTLDLSAFVKHTFINGVQLKIDYPSLIKEKEKEKEA